MKNQWQVINKEVNRDELGHTILVKDFTSRLKVHDGWLVKNWIYSLVSDNNELISVTQSQSMSFIPDTLHQWKIDNEC